MILKTERDKNLIKIINAEYCAAAAPPHNILYKKKGFGRLRRPKPFF